MYFLHSWTVCVIVLSFPKQICIQNDIFLLVTFKKKLILIPYLLIFIYVLIVNFYNVSDSAFHVAILGVVSFPVLRPSGFLSACGIIDPPSVGGICYNSVTGMSHILCISLRLPGLCVLGSSLCCLCHSVIPNTPPNRCTEWQPFSNIVTSIFRLHSYFFFSSLWNP